MDVPFLAGQDGGIREAQVGAGTRLRVRREHHGCGNHDPCKVTSFDWEHRISFSYGRRSIATGAGSAVCYNLRSRMVKTEREYREDICQVGRLVFQKGWVAANDGNITIRLDAEPLRFPQETIA